jgi:hypothetical protein
MRTFLMVSFLVVGCKSPSTKVIVDCNGKLWGGVLYTETENSVMVCFRVECIAFRKADCTVEVSK